MDQHLTVCGVHLVVNALPLTGALVIILCADALAFRARLSIFCVIGNGDGNHIVKFALTAKLKIIGRDLYAVIFICFFRELPYFQSFIPLKGVFPELNGHPVGRG